jgi:signal transduction histidine kinase/CheY-like chemotaxis protein
MLENKLFEALLDVIPFGAYAVDIETYEIVYANKIVRENMYAPQESYCWEKLYGQEQICPWCSIHRQSSGTLDEDDKHTCEFFDEIDDRWIKSYDEFISWPDGRNVKYSILVDTSDQKAAQGSMIQSHAKLAVKTKQISKTNKNLQITKLKLQKTVRELEEQRQKAEAATRSKSEFLANMSHEIRTPMNAILGMSHLALQTDLNAKQRNYIEKIDNSSKNLLYILNDILDFSKIEAGKLTIENIDFDMNEVFTRVRNIVELKAEEKGLKFDIYYDSTQNNIFFGDPLRLSQILINLTNNAIKFTERGKVSIKIDLLDTNSVRISVIDTGIGLSEEQQQKLFQSFSQADGSTTRRYGGTGLGLSISKQLVDLMHGKIWVESELDKGSSFIFDIPLPKGNPQNIITKDQKIDTDDITTLQNSNILLVEDNILNQEIVLGLLEQSGIIIDVANNGKEALEKYNTNKEKYELILMDIQMPILDGYETTKEIRKKDSDIPIVALTANAMKEDIARTKSAGMNAHLNKPIEVNKLNRVLLKYITKKTESKNTQELQNSELLIGFETIDTQKGLRYLGNNQNLYLRLLREFKKDYRDLNLDNIDDDSFELIIHTLKGLTGNIGAYKLNKIVQKLDRTLDRSLLPEFYKELNLVLDELEKKLKGTNEIKIKKVKITDDKKEELFKKLRVTADLMEPKKCQNILDEINKYELSKEDQDIIDNINKLINRYDFESILELL